MLGDKAGTYPAQNVVPGVTMASFLSSGEKNQDNWFRCGPRKCQSPVDTDLCLDFNFFKSSLFCPLIYIFETKVARELGKHASF